MGLAIRLAAIVVAILPNLATADSGPGSVRSNESKAVLSNAWFQRILDEERRRHWERAKARMMIPRVEFEYVGAKLQNDPPVKKDYK